MSERRSLNFESPGDIMPEVDRLLKAGHKTVGNWSLGQICHHLTGAIQFSIEGFPSLAPWPIRATIGKVIKRRVLSQGTFPDRVKIPKKFEPAAGLDDRAEAETLRAAIGVFGRHQAPMACHPFFGQMTLEEWRRFHAIHASHHLGFVVPSAVIPAHN